MEKINLVVFLAWFNQFAYVCWSIGSNPISRSQSILDLAGPTDRSDPENIGLIDKIIFWIPSSQANKR